MTRSRLAALSGLAILFLALAALAALARPAGRPQGLAVVVYKSPTCGCCAKWVDYMKAQGYQVTVHDMDDVDPIKDQQHVPGDLRSCHTALVGGYVIEGHVPADLIQKLIKEKSTLAGLAVPGMVAGSPGMDGGAKEAYDVVSFDKSGKTGVYAKR
ncbi:MAG: DUF411 domain-containing protein [Gemmatimonadetes bacterium]|nr:DUF411 domain-containing protein [Gemmatimonadota bacterium]